MKAVKFVFSGKYEVKPSLTYGKIYDVLNCRINPVNTAVTSAGTPVRPIITIKNDFGEDVEYFMNDSFDENVWFEDATPYIRDEKLNKLGI